MFATRIAVFSALPNAARCRFPASDPTSSARLRNPKPTDGFLLRLPQSSQQHRRRKMEILAELGDSGVEPGSSESPESWKNQWLLGLVATIFVPFLTRKWGPLLRLTKQAEAKMKMVDEVVEAVEKAAEDVERAAEDIVDKLPATGKLRAFVDAVANAADRISDGAQIVDDAIDGVEKVVEDLETKLEAAEGSEDDESARKGKKEVEPEDDKAAAASAGKGKKEVKPVGASDQAIVES